MVFEDDFSNGINTIDWNYEIEVGGFGTGSFDWTTNDPENVYTDETGLHIVPTITTEAANITLDQATNGYILNLTAQGICSSTQAADCVRVKQYHQRYCYQPRALRPPHHARQTQHHLQKIRSSRQAPPWRLALARRLDDARSLALRSLAREW